MPECWATIRAPVPPVRRRGTGSDRPVAANPPGEEKGQATSRRRSPARIAAIVGLSIVVIALLVIVFSGGGSHKYKLVFQNASQLVNGNQVLVGGHPVGSVENISLTSDNLAEIEVSIDQELHEGTTATVARDLALGRRQPLHHDHPGARQQPGPRRRRDARPRLDHLGGRPRPVHQHVPGLGPQSARQIHPRLRRMVCRQRHPGQRRLQILRPRPQPGRRLRPRPQRRLAPILAVRRQHQQTLDRRSRRGASS